MGMDGFANLKCLWGDLICMVFHVDKLIAQSKQASRIHSPNTCGVCSYATGLAV